MTSRIRRCPSIWTLVACGVAAVALPAWWVALHPGIWGHREFEGMAQTLILAPFSMAGGVVILVLATIGMIKKDPLAFLVLAVTAILVVWFYSVREL